MPGKNNRLLQLGMLALAVIPPTVAVSGSLEAGKRLQILIPLAIIYEVILIGVGTFVHVWRDAWRDLEGRWSKRLADYIDLALIRRFSRFERKYREYMNNSNRFVDLKGLATLGEYTPQFDEIFVDVSLAARPPHDAVANPIGDLPFHISERRSIWDFLPSSTPVVLAIIGAPGTGKTTLLRHVVRHVGAKRKGNRNLPVLLFLREHVKEIVKDSEVTLPSLIRSNIPQLARHEPHGWFEDQLEEGNCVVLLDGLDEVADIEDRKHTVAWLEKQIAHYSKNDFVVTSRPQGYQVQPLSTATVLQTRPFTETQIERFVNSWYVAIERRSTGATGEDIRLRAESESEDLLRRLRLSPHIHDLAVNPLLLTMIVHVHRYRGALPGSRADLYSEICQVLLWRRQGSKNIPSELRGAQKEAALKELAYIMMSKGLRDLPRDDMRSLLVDLMPKISTAVDPSDFLKDIESNGLIVERETGLCSFVHQTFQEYLASQYIRENALVQELVNRVEDSWWRETILLYAAGGQVDSLIKASIDCDTVYTLTVAFDCRDVAVQIAPDLQEKLGDLLGQAYDPLADPERRRLMMRIIASRQLRRTIQSQAGTAFCAMPVPVEVYGLFLAEQAINSRRATSVRPQYVQGDADRAAVGMRGSDAIIFVTWLNSLVGPSTSYRLPTNSEMQDLEIEKTLDLTNRSVWVSSDALQPDTLPRLPELWVPKEVQHPYRLRQGSLQEYIEEDLKKVNRTPRMVGALALEIAYLSTLVSQRGRDLAGALYRERAPYGDDESNRGREALREMEKYLQLTNFISADLSTIDRTIKSLGRSRSLYLARKRLRVSTRASRDPFREIDRELIVSLGRPLQDELDQITSLLRMLRSCGSDWNFPTAARSGVTYQRHLVDRIEDSFFAFQGHNSELEDSFRVAMSLIVRHAMANGIDLLSQRFSKYYAGAVVTSDTPYFPEDLSRLAEEGLRRIVGFREPGNDHFIVNWCTWSACIIAKLVDLVTSDSFVGRDFDANFPILIRLASLGIVVNSTVLDHDIPELSQIYSEILSGVTVLEERANGIIKPTEVIFLVKE